MREFPVQHRAHAIRADNEIAVAEIAMHQRHLIRRSGIVIAQPAQRQFEYRARPVEAAIFALEIGDFLCRRHVGEVLAVVPVAGRGCRRSTPPSWRANNGRALANCSSRKILRGDGLALDPLHDEASAEVVLRPQHMQHAR